MAEPCFRCGVRADIGCKHQPATGAPPATIEREKKAKKKPVHSFWGAKGNPAGPARERILNAMKKSLNG